ncbi:hypothetical protein KHC33_04085 [Methanospirillum sp. J.3.6.1-F.2.7.3]|uniref:Tetratricopeptide repeat protein n=1 Tax=Methanospirillum purgamenti TaxID=2834276 RepID=A0A8E7B3B8_9EURY|nr:MULTISPECIES: tetratricopeptide repeat protein [Methanospirillum]MDX8551780.1 hypothetical protein [Methanospirillum hungatei]QVV89702.1 hypothetical protein KHC33_04085 [Methanospirillum sp. J.3.6.1-F.2.7.3]
MGVFSKKEDDATKMLKKALSLELDGQYQDAIDILNKAILIEPKNQAIWISEVRIYEKLGFKDVAKEIIEKGLATYPNSGFLWELKGDWDFKGGEIQESILSFDKSLTIDPNNAPLWIKKSNAYIILEKYQETLEALNVCISIDPRNLDALSRKLLCFNKLGNYQEIIKMIDDALSENPKEPTLWCEKGYCLYKLGRKHESNKALENACFLNPNISKVYLEKGISLYNKKIYQSAIETFEIGLLLDPNNWIIWYHKGLCHLCLDQNKDAIDIFEKGLLIHPKSADLWARKGFSLINTNQFQEAYEALDISLSINPNNEIARREIEIVTIALENMGIKPGSWDPIIHLDKEDPIKHPYSQSNIMNVKNNDKNKSGTIPPLNTELSTLKRDKNKETRVTCKTCGHVYCYNNLDVMNNITKKIDNTARFFGSLANSPIGGRKSEDTIDYKRCQKCGSRNIISEIIYFD